MSQIVFSYSRPLVKLVAESLHTSTFGERRDNLTNFLARVNVFVGAMVSVVTSVVTSVVGNLLNLMRMLRSISFKQ